MNFDRSTILAVSVVAVVTTVLVGGFFFTHKRVEKEVQVPASGEARKNPYLALERLLVAEGLTARTVKNVEVPSDELPADGWGEIIILADSSREISPEQANRWAHWVNSGGHLILPAPVGIDDAKAAPLLSRFEFHYEAPPKEEEEEGKADDSKLPENGEASSEEAIAQESGAEQPAPDEAVPADQDGPRTVEPVYQVEIPAIDKPPPLRWNSPGMDWEAEDIGGRVVARSRAMNTGRVTLVREAGIFENGELGNGEHASLIWDIIALSARPENTTLEAVIVPYGARQSWMAYVLGYTWPMFVVLLVILALSIQNGSNRFGPLLPQPPRERRSRLEHIEAMGRFLWQHGSTAHLLEATQEALVDAVAHRRPSVRTVRPADKHTIVAEELDIDVREARRLLQPPSATGDPKSFTGRILTMETYRRKL